MVICDTNIRRPSFLFSKRTGEIFLTRLSNYIPFLIGKNLALIKINIEGSEGKALESGIELITKYHIPFIFLEFTKDSLSLHGTNPIQFLNLFLDNGYQISINNFLDKTYNQYLPNSFYIYLLKNGFFSFNLYFLNFLSENY